MALLPASAAGTIGAAGIAGHAAGGSYGSGSSTSNGYSLGTSANSSWNSYSDVSDHYGISNSYGESSSWEMGENWSNSNSENWSNVYGSEATAKDRQMAYEADLRQMEMWRAQAQYNAEQAEIDRQYQAYMSNTSYQRAVADLLAAGLNPILAAGNMGASTPVGAMATTSLGSAHKGVATADQNSYGYSNSSSYGYNKGGSHSYNSSSSYERSHSQGSGSGGSYGSSKDYSRSSSKSSNSYSNNAKGFLEGVGGVVKDALSGISKYFRNPVPTPTH